MARKATIELPYRLDLRPYQKPVFNYIVRDGGKRAFWCVHRRGGKDIVSLNTIICMATQRVGNYLYTLPTMEQAKKIIWRGKTKDGRPFLDFIPKPLIKRKNETEKFIELVNGSMIALAGTDDIDAIMGQNPVGVVFSEYSLQKPEAWQFISPILEENDGWALFQGTARPPAEAPHFKELYDVAQKSDNWFWEMLTVDDTGVISAEKIQQEVDEGTIKPHLVRQEYYNDFWASTENILIKAELMRSAIDRKISFRHAPICAGLDVGMSLGGDPSALVVRQGGMILGIYETRKDKTEEVVGWAAEKMRSHNCGTVVVDANTWGKGVADLLPARGFTVYGVNSSEKPAFRDLFNRRRDELWWRAKEFFEEMQCCIPSTIPLYMQLINELSGVTYTHTPTSKVKIESKDDMRKRSGSPNLADALCLALAEEGNSADITFEKPKFLAA